MAAPLADVVPGGLAGLSLALFGLSLVAYALGAPPFAVLPRRVAHVFLAGFVALGSLAMVGNAFL